MYKALGRRIRIAREAARRTQEDLARRVGITRTSISNIESGRQQIQVHTLFAIAEALDVPPETLLPKGDFRGELPIEEQLPRDLKPQEREWVRRLIVGPKPG